jgi:hypothetical protein
MPQIINHAPTPAGVELSASDIFHDAPAAAAAELPNSDHITLLGLPSTDLTPAPSDHLFGG